MVDIDHLQSHLDSVYCEIWIIDLLLLFIMGIYGNKMRLFVLRYFLLWKKDIDERKENLMLFALKNA